MSSVSGTLSPHPEPHTEGEDLPTPPEPEGEESRLSSDEESLDGLRIVDPNETGEGFFENNTNTAGCNTSSGSM